VRTLVIFLVAIVILTAGTQANAAPRAELWPRWTAHDPASSLAVNHAPWDRFLNSYVVAGPDGVNRVRYGDVTVGDRAALRAYIDQLASVVVSRYRRADQFAYWINLYNALTVQLILDHAPIESILQLNISPGWLSVGPWGKKLVRIENELLSLDDIEHRILRPIWRDPRIHYVVNCASIGCPNLGTKAYTGDNVDALLTRAARDYVNNPRGVQFDAGDLYVSSIYKWYRADFGGGARGVIAHLREYAAPALAAKLSKFNDISGYQYDWSLNDAGRP